MKNTRNPAAWSVLREYRLHVVELAVALGDLAEISSDDDSGIFLAEFESGEKSLAQEFLKPMLTYDGVKSGDLWDHVRRRGTPARARHAACSISDRGFFADQGCHAAQVLDGHLVELFELADQSAKRIIGRVGFNEVRPFCDVLHDFFLNLPSDGEIGSSREAVTNAKVEYSHRDQGIMRWPR